MPQFLLLQDGASKLFLQDGVSYLLLQAAGAAAGIIYTQLERGIRGLNRGLCMGTRG